MQRARFHKTDQLRYYTLKHSCCTLAYIHNFTVTKYMWQLLVFCWLWVYALQYCWDHCHTQEIPLPKKKKKSEIVPAEYSEKTAIYRHQGEKMGNI
jgi:hypothetical protein